ncbi:MAG: phosphoribosylformylglycinamidine synthase subunit PurQ [Gammaproteobacteria bacterium]|nr:phosphoribosylformylglycinamidine synthase subunit PurQ [Gammaproteobacteria bacterium]
MKFGIVVFPGSNCDDDCRFVLADKLGHEVFFLWHKTHDLNGADCLVLPGGFSYGDYLRCGAMAANSPIMKQVSEFADNGGLVIGICNGFQILQEARLLPGTLITNNALKFICKYVYVRVENIQTPFTNFCHEGEILRIPIAHMDGNFFVDKKNFESLEDNNQILFRYCSEDGEISNGYNPNGSIGHVAGIMNKEGNICGMMPHPERCSEKTLGNEQGVKIFSSIINHFNTNKSKL